MKIQYDKNHKPPVFEEEVYLKISKKQDKGYYLENHTKLSFNKIGPFKIIKPVGDLAYEIELPTWLRIHLVISVEHFIPVTKDIYNRPKPEPGYITVEGEERYIIEKVLGEQIRTTANGTKTLYLKIK
jgi:hypothetical protein